MKRLIGHKLTGGTAMAGIFTIASFSVATQSGQPTESVKPPPNSPAPAARPDALMTRLEEIDARIGAIKDLVADFEQRKYTAMLKKPLLSSGHVAVKGERIRWDTIRPRPSSMTIGPGEVRLYDPQEKVVEVYEAQGDMRELTGSPLPRLRTLTPRFDIAAFDPANLDVVGREDGGGGGGGWRDERYVGMEMTPKTDELKKHLAMVRVVIDSTIPCLVRMEITDADGDRTMLELKDIKVNTGVSDARVQLTVPAGTRISRPMGGGKSADDAKPAPEPSTLPGSPK